MASISQLYNTFSNEIPSTELTPAKKEEFVKNVKKLDEKGNEIFFVLMKIQQNKVPMFLARLIETDRAQVRRLSGTRRE